MVYVPVGMLLAYPLAAVFGLLPHQRARSSALATAPATPGRRGAAKKRVPSAPARRPAARRAR
ncbi:MAG: hypothetical protein EPO22_01585 [Dehalococcoidia bacterium]|nr:MAG: hypothetical protein EPO22_01585 [Dehalococcoidia bacterium]